MACAADDDVVELHAVRADSVVGGFCRLFEPIQPHRGSRKVLITATPDNVVALGNDFPVEAKAQLLLVESPHIPLVPAKAGTQSVSAKNWIPAFAGMSGLVSAINKRALAFAVGRIDGAEPCIAMRAVWH
jgi:hypothetical protein